MEWILTWPFGNYVSKIIFISNQQYSCTIKMCFYGSPLLSLVKHKTISKSQTHYWLLSFVCLIIEKEEICCVCLCFPITDDEIGWKDSTRFWWRKRGWMMSIPNVVYRNDLLVECGLNPICRRLAANIMEEAPHLKGWPASQRRVKSIDMMVILTGPESFSNPLAKRS